MDYGTPFLNKHFARNKKLKEEIKKKGFGIRQGLKTSELQKDWWMHSMKSKANKKFFETAWADMVQKKLKSGKVKTGYDVPRGIDVEHLFYKMEHGYSDKQYAKHLQSYD